jgi:hypothetical protein
MATDMTHVGLPQRTTYLIVALCQPYQVTRLGRPPRFSVSVGRISEKQYIRHHSHVRQSIAWIHAAWSWVSWGSVIIVNTQEKPSKSHTMVDTIALLGFPVQCIVLSNSEWPSGWRQIGKK